METGGNCKLRQHAWAVAADTSQMPNSPGWVLLLSFSNDIMKPDNFIIRESPLETFISVSKC